jgi:hypothetical protein
MKILMSAVVVLICWSNASCLQSTTDSQDQPKSLADIARESRQQKAQSQPKVVITDESFSSKKKQAADVARKSSEPQTSRQTIPDLYPNNEDNTDEVIQAIEDIKNRQGAAEAEAALHTWYDKHDALILQAIEKNKQMAAASNKDSPEGVRNALHQFVLQLAFIRVHLVATVRLHLNTEWFLLRCADGSVGECQKHSSL